MFDFPEGFLWGAATSAHQVEGGNHTSDYWALEHVGGIFGEPSGDARDHYHRYREDLDLLADAGLNAFRFGVEWARIEPEPGFVSHAALDHYRRVAEACVARGITPIPTLSHFTIPRWFALAGGWAQQDSASRFADYCAAVMARLHDIVSWVCTINEPNLGTFFQVTGNGSLPPSLASVVSVPGTSVPSTDTVADALFAAHASASSAIRAEASDIKLGWTLAIVDVEPGPEGEALAANIRERAFVDWLVAARGDDFVGVQTYHREYYGPGGYIPPSGTRQTEMGWEFYPEALGVTIRMAAEIAGVPVIVTENGIATADDNERIEYTGRALGALAACMADGCDVRGYIHWSLLDNFELLEGFRPKFGLIAVDRQTFERRPKPSLQWLGQVARANAARV